jgi:hypothetical protein
MKYRKKRKSQEAANLEKLKSRFLADTALKGQQVVFKSSGEKMSEVLEEFIEPYVESATTPEAYQKLIALAIIAWNAALLEETERQNLITRSIEAIRATAGKEWKKDLQDFLATLIERKQRYFANNKRYILNYHLSETKKGYHLAVISTHQ